MPKFNVGDIVRVVDEPYDDCPFLWVPSMTEYCGKEVTIASVGDSGEDLYRIEEDDGYCAWCENCFVPVSIEPDFEPASIDELQIFLGV